MKTDSTSLKKYNPYFNWYTSESSKIVEPCSRLIAVIPHSVISSLSYLRNMVLYNITIILDEEIQDNWLNWANNSLIPSIMDTNLFVSNRTLRVLDSHNEGVTYCIQFIADDLNKYNQYQDKFATTLTSAQPAEFENKCYSFTTVMEFVN